MSKKTVRDISVSGKRVLARVDFNVPQDDSGAITDDRRIRSALPTIQHILKGGGRLILMSHLGRPEGKDRAADQAYTLAPAAVRLSELLGQPVPLAADCVGAEAAKVVGQLRDGQCCMLENLRFHAAEQIKDKDGAKDPAKKQAKEAFARQLAELADVYVNDAFGTCHRDNASMLTVPQLMAAAGKPRVLGFLVEKELKFLGEAVANPKRPFVVIMGGAKVSDKIAVIEALRTRCDQILIGGAMMFTFWGAAGLPVGRSLHEPDKYELAMKLRTPLLQSRAREVEDSPWRGAGSVSAEGGTALTPSPSQGETEMGNAEQKSEVGRSKSEVQPSRGAILHIPIDAVCGAELKAGVPTQVSEQGVPDGQMGLDIGPKTLDAFRFVLAKAQTIVWNGPMGAFETPPFDKGTMAIAQELAKATARGAVTIIGGGDSAAAVEEAGLADRMTHVSTGGGASLEFLEGKKFAALEVIEGV